MTGWRSTGAREGQAGPVGESERSIVPWKPGNAGGKGYFQTSVESGHSREIGDESITSGNGWEAPERHCMRKRRRLRAIASMLYDKVYRRDVLVFAYERCRPTGAAGVDGQTFADIEAYGERRWLEELAEELQDKTYRPAR